MADVKGHRERVRAGTGGGRGAESRGSRGRSDIGYDRTSVVERRRLRFSIFKIITSVSQGQRHANWGGGRVCGGGHVV